MITDNQREARKDGIGSSDAPTAGFDEYKEYNEDEAEIISFPCDERGIISSHKKKYNKTGKLFKGRFQLIK
jgi:hypothetical protein